MKDFNEEELEADGIDEAEFTKGFNWGYGLAETNETLVKGIVEQGLGSTSDHSKGFEAGAMEKFREKEALQVILFLKTDQKTEISFSMKEIR